MKRTARIVFKNGEHKDLPIASFVHVNTEKKSLALNELKNGKGYCLAIHPSLVDDFTQVVKIEILRED
jgi:hypothetical protein